MNHKILLIGAFVSIALTASVMIADAQGPRPGSRRAPTTLAGTAFTYQGQLKNSGALVNGTCDFQFGLWDSLTLGAQVGTTQTVSSLSVTNGLFTTSLDFSGSAFTGDARWLAIRVRCPSGGGAYTSLAPRESLAPAPIAFSLPGLYTQQNSTSPNIIGGYSGNIISPTVAGATIGGGGDDINPNKAWTPFGTIGGGAGNTTSGTGDATVAGGAGNTASGLAANVAGGTLNTASGERAAVGGGFSNSASGAFSSIPGGYYGVAPHYGEIGYSSGLFAAAGDSQTSIYILRNTTTDANPTELFLDGGFAGANSQRITIASNRVLIFDILVVGTNINNGNSASYRLSGLIKNIGGTTAFVGSPNQIVFGEDNAAWDATVVADNTNDALAIQVTGAGSADIRWVAAVRTVEVAY